MKNVYFRLPEKSEKWRLRQYNHVEIMLLTVSSSSMILEKKYHQQTLAICKDYFIMQVHC